LVVSVFLCTTQIVKLLVFLFFRIEEQLEGIAEEEVGENME